MPSWFPDSWFEDSNGNEKKAKSELKRKIGERKYKNLKARAMKKAALKRHLAEAEKKRQEDSEGSGFSSEWEWKDSWSSLSDWEWPESWSSMPSWFPDSWFAGADETEKKSNAFRVKSLLAVMKKRNMKN